MLTSRSIRNVVLIEALDLEFGAGWGVLTGETGAGKSILLDSLGLALGARADSGLVRQGEERASVTATILEPRSGDPLRAVLAENRSEEHTLNSSHICAHRMPASAGTKK